MVASENTYVGNLVKRVGGENIITDAPADFSPVDMEYLADKNPEYILFMAHANPEESLAAFKEEFETNPAWQNFDAVKNDKVIALETGYFGMSANLLAADAMEKLAGILYEQNEKSEENKKCICTFKSLTYCCNFSGNPYRKRVCFLSGYISGNYDR